MSLAIVRGIHRGPVDFPHKGPVTWKIFHLMTSSWISTWSYLQEKYKGCVMDMSIWVSCIGNFRTILKPTTKQLGQIMHSDRYNLPSILHWLIYGCWRNVYKHVHVLMMYCLRKQLFWCIIVIPQAEMIMGKIHAWIAAKVNYICHNYICHN